MLLSECSYIIIVLIVNSYYYLLHACMQVLYHKIMQTCDFTQLSLRYNTPVTGNSLTFTITVYIEKGDDYI